MSAEDADRFAGLHQQRLVVLQRFEFADDGVEGRPIPRGFARAAVDDKPVRASATSGSRLFMSIRRAAS